MTLNQAFESSAPGQRLKHGETQLVLVRRELFMDTIRGLSPQWLTRTNTDDWSILQTRKQGGRP